MATNSKIDLGDPEAFSVEDFLALADEEETAQRQQALEAFGQEGVRLTITIPGAIDPVQRLEQFEEPLAHALGGRAILHGGGTAAEQVDGRYVVKEVDIGLTVADFEEALPLIRACLKAQGAARGTTIFRTGEDDAVFPLDAD